MLRELLRGSAVAAGQSALPKPARMGRMHSDEIAVHGQNVRYEKPGGRSLLIALEGRRPSDRHAVLASDIEIEIVSLFPKSERRILSICIEMHAYRQPFGQHQVNQPKRIRQR